MIKALTACFLLLVATPVWAATARESTFNCSETQTSFSTDDTFSDYFSLGFDRTGESAKDFLFIGIMATQVTNLDTMGHVRLRHDSATATLQDYLTDRTSSQLEANEAGNGSTYYFLEKVNLSGANHTFSLEATRSGGTGNYNVEMGCLLIMEAPSDIQYAEIETQVKANATSEALDLSFTPGTAEDYVVMYSAHVSNEDESDGGSTCVLFGRDDNDDGTFDVEYAKEGACHHVGVANDEGNPAPDPIVVGYSAGFMYVENLAASATHLILQIDGGGGANEALMQRGSIAAIPESYFETLYYIAESSAPTARFDEEPFQNDIDLDAGADGENGAITQTLAAATHFFAYFSEAGSEDGDLTEGACLQRMQIAGTSREHNYTQVRREDASNDYWHQGIMWVETYGSSASRTTQAQVASGDADATHQCGLNRRALVVAELPAQPVAGGRTRRMF